MHFFYADETGSTGKDLRNVQQPVFALGGISVRDQGWNQTHNELQSVIREYFAPQDVPAGFELHAHELLSPNGDGPFAGHDRERRSSLVDKMLDLLEGRKHDVIVVVVDKAALADNHDADLSERPHLYVDDPYALAFDQYISAVEKHVRERLGRTARAMVIVDEHDKYEAHVDEVIDYRRNRIGKTYRTKWIVEFAYAIDSKRNPMMQLTDLVLYITRRFFEVDRGYRAGWPSEARNVYREWYKRIHARRRNKSLVEYEDRHREPVNTLLRAIACTPSRKAFELEAVA